MADDPHEPIVGLASSGGTGLRDSRTFSSRLSRPGSRTVSSWLAERDARSATP